MAWKARIHVVCAFALFGMSIPGALRAQDQTQGALETATRIRCDFSQMAVGTWGAAGPEVSVQAADLVLQFDGINADEGTARLESGFGTYDIIVRYAGGYLHFIQSFRDGPLYSTTVMENETGTGKLKAMHSRHEHTDFALPGFTSSPEQYYGECEIQ